MSGRQRIGVSAGRSQIWGVHSDLGDTVVVSEATHSGHATDLQRQPGGRWENLEKARRQAPLQVKHMEHL